MKDHLFVLLMLCIVMAFGCLGGWIPAFVASVMAFSCQVYFEARGI